MASGVVASVAPAVENAGPGPATVGPPIAVQLLGPFAIRRGDQPLALPSSRKVRALLAYLLLATQPVPRSRLCELLWDLPNDPRGELRWCLSKLRSLIDEPGRRRLISQGDAVALDLADGTVDALTVGRAVQAGLADLPVPRLRALAELCQGEFLAGLAMDRQAEFDHWLTAQRHRLRACHVALLERLAASLDGEEQLRHLAGWLELAPFDQRAHAAQLTALAGAGRLREGAEHLAATIRHYEAEGLDPAPIRTLWRSVRGQPGAAARPALVVAAPPAPAGLVLPEHAASSTRRPAIAVMPFVEQPGEGVVPGGPADGLAHDIITRLAKLRSLFVIAQGTMFALGERNIGPPAAGRMLNVDYVVSGALQRPAGRFVVTVELAETRTARIVWTERFDQRADDAFLVLDEIGNRIVAAIAHEIETLERNRAILKPPDSLDAWEAHHRGLWHMYRFNRADNQLAQQFFATAVRLDPTFSQAHAGLSFTYFQDAFQGWRARDPAIEQAFASAGQSLMADERDPTAHWALGRALWLRGQQDQALVELTQAVELSPNFALGHYTLAFVHAQAGDPSAAIAFADHSRHLSPFDPLLFGMLGSKAMALVRLQRFDEAAEWAIKAAARPNAHAHILAIAGFCLAMAGRLAEARPYLARIKAQLPGYRIEDFLTAMRLAPDGAALFRQAASRID